MKTLTLPNNKSPLHWAFQEYLENQPFHFFKPFLRSHKKLQLKYRLLVVELNDSLKNSPPQMADKELIITTLMMAEFLEYLECHFLKNTSQINRLHKEQETYHKLLTQWTNYHFELKRTQQLSFNEEMKKVVDTSLWLRLLMLRLRTLCMEGLQAPSLKELHTRFEQIDLLVQPIFSYSGWLLHCGRLLHNSLYLMQHIIPGDWMSEREKRIGLAVRMEVNLQSQWVELVNDMFWLISVVLNPPILFFSAVNFILELFIVGLQAWIEIRHLKTILDKLKAGSLEENASVRYLNQCIMHEKKKYCLELQTLLSQQP